MKWRNPISIMTTWRDGVTFRGGRNSGTGGVIKNVLIAFLVGGYLGNCGVNISMNRANAALTEDVKNLKVKIESYKVVALSCQMVKAKSISQVKEENFIPSPGRLFQSEIDYQDFINEFFRNENADRVCFGRGWSTIQAERTLDDD